mgnify:CR=1 FL=1
MAKIDKQIITMRKIEDGTAMRQYSAVSGECQGIATIAKHLSLIHISEPTRPY